jgi:photosystem II stability/assembly factor-like uncharacterized protein
MKRSGSTKYMLPFAVLTLALTMGCGPNAGSGGAAGSASAPPAVIGNPSNAANTAGSSSPSSTPTPAGTANAAAPTPSTDSAGAVKPAEFQIQTKLTDVHLLGDKLGYAWGVTAKELRLYRTEDGGLTWTQASPQAETNLFNASPQEQHDIFILDRDHLWVFRASQDGVKPTMLRSTDGGASWTSTELPDNVHSGALQFINPDNGWMLSSSDAAMGKSEKSLFATKDGGATWERIMENSGYLPTENPTPQAIPQSGHFRGISFRDVSNGFVPLETIDGKLKLYGTTDGGHTWSEIVLQAPELPKDSFYTIEEPPVFWGTDGMNGWFPVVIRANESQRYDAFFTSDGGQSWTYQPLNTKPSNVRNEASGITFVNDQEGWLLKDGLLSHTLDRGATWQQLAVDPVLAEALKAYPYVGKIEFTDSKIGWLLVKNEDGSQSRLLQTTDGGKSWKVL